MKIWIASIVMVVAAGLPVLATGVELYERPDKDPLMLTPELDIDRPVPEFDFYRKPDGTLVGIGRGIILKTTPGMDLRLVLNELKLKLIATLGDDMFLLETEDRRLTPSKVNQLIQLEGILYAHPDYLRIVEPR